MAIAAFGSFSTGDAMIKLVSATLSIPQIVLVMTTSMVGYGLVELWRKRSAEPIQISNPGLVTLRAALMGAAMLFTFNALNLLPLSDAYTILFTMPLIVAMLSPLVLGERVGVWRWGAVIIGFCGVAFAFRPDTATVGLGHAVALGGAMCFGVSMLLLRRIGTAENAGVLLVSAALGQIIAATVLLIWPSAPSMLWPTLYEASLLLVICLVSMVGQRLLIGAHRRGEVSVIAAMQYTQMVWGILYGYLLFSDLPTVSVVVGAMIVVGCGIVILLLERRRAIAAQ